MRKFSLVLAAAVMAVGLAVPGSVSAKDKPTNYEILMEGEILMKSGQPSAHFFTVHYDEVIYGCMSMPGLLFCKENKKQKNKAK
jgi:hypothetical protein